MSARVNRQIVYKRARATGMPVPDDFALVESPVPQPREGEFLSRTIYLSIDPHGPRVRMDASHVGRVVADDTVMWNTVSEVVESRNPAFAVGDLVLGTNGWQEYGISSGGGRLGVRKVEPTPAPISYYLGVLGNTGMTAYFPVTQVCRPKAGETFVVSAAAGSVGSVAGQMARIAGCRVVGIAGSDAKCDFVVNELGFDACVNHRTPDLGAALSDACPKGIDVYFDNVAGPVLDTVLNHINMFARIALVGGMALYNAETPPAPPDLWRVLIKRAILQGAGWMEHMDKEAEFRAEMGQWLAEGKIRYREDIVVGIENAPAHLIGLMQGKNIGKALVRVSDDPTRT